MRRSIFSAAARITQLVLCLIKSSDVPRAAAATMIVNISIDASVAYVQYEQQRSLARSMRIEFCFDPTYTYPYAYTCMQLIPNASSSRL